MKNEIYLKAFNRLLNEDSIDTKKLIFLGVKAIGRNFTKAMNQQEATENHAAMTLIVSLMEKLTPRELEQLFPITKEYDGAKYECKDYYYTKNYLKQLPQGKPIGDGILDLLWEYHNIDLRFFNIRLFSAIDDMRKFFEGKGSMMTEFLADHGVQSLILHKDSKGREFIIDGNGKVNRVKPVRHLRIV